MSSGTPTLQKLGQMRSQIDRDMQKMLAAKNTITHAIYHMESVAKFRRNLLHAETTDEVTLFGNGHDMSVSEYIIFAKEQIQIHESNLALCVLQIGIDDE